MVGPFRCFHLSPHVQLQLPLTALVCVCVCVCMQQTYTCTRTNMSLSQVNPFFLVNSFESKQKLISLDGASLSGLRKPFVVLHGVCYYVCFRNFKGQKLSKNMHARGGITSIVKKTWNKITSIQGCRKSQWYWKQLTKYPCLLIVFWGCIILEDANADPKQTFPAISCFFYITPLRTFWCTAFVYPRNLESKSRWYAR